MPDRGMGINLLLKLWSISVSIRPCVLPPLRLSLFWQCSSSLACDSGLANGEKHRPISGHVWAKRCYQCVTNVLSICYVLFGSPPWEAVNGYLFTDHGLLCLSASWFQGQGGFQIESTRLTTHL